MQIWEKASNSLTKLKYLSLLQMSKSSSDMQRAILKKNKNLSLVRISTLLIESTNVISMLCIPVTQISFIIFYNWVKFLMMKYSGVINNVCFITAVISH